MFVTSSFNIRSSITEKPSFLPFMKSDLKSKFFFCVHETFTLVIQHKKISYLSYIKS